MSGGRPKRNWFVPNPAAVRMRKLREKHDLRQSDFADLVTEAGVYCSQVLVCQLESGERKVPSLMVAFAIQRATRKLGKAIPAEAWTKWEGASTT